jgi:hypothetical protein
VEFLFLSFLLSFLHSSFFSGLWLTKFAAWSDWLCYSFGVTVALHNDRADPLHSGNVPTSSESEAGRNVGGI